MPKTTIKAPKPNHTPAPQLAPLASWLAWTRPLVAWRPLRRYYVWGSLLILAVTTIFWSILGARLQAGNADQLSDPYLFSAATTFHGATFPGTHSFLLKWPIFWLIKLGGLTASSLTIATVAVAVLTVGGLAVVLYKIERRPLVLGTWYLAVATSLLLVPAQPYAGGLLPVNMAMLTTRNIEYLVYLAALILLVRAPRYKSWRFGIAVGLLCLLVASDKLFLGMSAGGALLALVTYSFVRNWGLVTLSVRWLYGTVLAGLGSASILAAIRLSGVTHFVNDASTNPYALAGSAKDLLLGAVYAVLGIFTNAGANPAYGATELRQFPHQFLAGLLSIGGLAYLGMAVLVGYGLWFVWRLVGPTLLAAPKRVAKLTTASQLSLLLIWTSLASMALFVGTKHYYAVDARYLAICWFTLVIAAATLARKLTWRPEYLIFGGSLLVVCSLLGVVQAQHTYHTQSSALSATRQRNSDIVQALAHHKVAALVGDYWRVLPVKLAAQGKLTTLPLGNCTQPRQSLTSTAWQPNLQTHSFAYLLSLDGSLTDFPHCSLGQVTAAYGRPNSSLVVAGTVKQPKELLLFYDQGIHLPPKGVLQPHAAVPTSVVPVPLTSLAGTICNGPTIMNVVAHQDDDLLFINPDTLHDLRAGHCIRTVYVTAGDSGGNKFYWLNRQLGSQAAYSNMLGTDNVWVQRLIELSPHEFITIASPKDNPKISLIFMNLPDGNTDGTGFAASHHESLQKLAAGSIKSMQTVDGQSSYSNQELTSALSQLMHTYLPSTIRTQADFVSTVYPDHSDHIATGHFAEEAAKAYDLQQFNNSVMIPVETYIGYPIHANAENVSGEDLTRKEAAFFAYAHYDGAVCHSMRECSDGPVYGAYLPRQYQYNPNE